ncbi:MAG: tetratricopeptide repeat protein [Bacteroidaceae bacterium]|nr:tetratricopeptide repeat protein [Bacteroidaceae bacterium]
MPRFILLILSFIITLPLVAQSPAWSAMQRGNEAYRQGHYAEAEKCFLQLLQQQPDYAAAHYNLGLAYMGQQQTEAALKSFEEAIQHATEEDLAARAWHNIGVIRQGQALTDAANHTSYIRQAAEAYKESLRLHPSDDETRYNLALCQEQLRQEQSQQQQDQQDQQDSSSSQPQDQPQESQDPTQQLMNLAQRAEDDTRQKIQDARAQQRNLDKNW